MVDWGTVKEELYSHIQKPVVDPFYIHRLFYEQKDLMHVMYFRGTGGKKPSDKLLILVSAVGNRQPQFLGL